MRLFRAAALALICLCILPGAAVAVETNQAVSLGAQNLTAEFLALHRTARNIPSGSKARFDAAFTALRGFVMQHDYRAIDPGNVSPAVLTALNDYGFWLAKTGELLEAESVLNEVLRRNPERTVAYLNRADARWRLRERSRFGSGGYDFQVGLIRRYSVLAREDYRLYCSRRLASQQAIPVGTARRIGVVLDEPVLSAAACQPRLPLLVAVGAGNLDKVRALLAEGLDPDTIDANGNSALNLAVYARRLDMVHVLLAAGAKADSSAPGTPLLEAAMPRTGENRPYKDGYAIADALIAAGANPHGDKRFPSPLIFRHMDGFIDRQTLEYLFSKVTDLNLRDDLGRGRSLMHAATEHPKTLWLADVLLEKGADINATYRPYSQGEGVSFETPLLAALRAAAKSAEISRASYIESDGGIWNTYPMKRVVDFLLMRGADPSIGGSGDNGLDDALVLAVRTLRPQLLDQLVKAASNRQAPLNHRALSSLLSFWNKMQAREYDYKDGGKRNVQMSRLAALTEHLLRLGVSLTYVENATKEPFVAPLSLPWLPDELYGKLLKAGAHPDERSASSLRLSWVDPADAYPLVSMLQMQQNAKIEMLLDHNTGAFRDPASCGRAVADSLAWQLSMVRQPISPLAGRAIKHVLDRAERSDDCDLNATSVLGGYRGISASELLRRASVTLKSKPVGAKGQMQIFIAIQAGDVEALRAELSKGQDPNAVNEDGVLALNLAVRLDQLDSVRALLAAGANPNGGKNSEPPLELALLASAGTGSAKGRYAMADALIAGGASVDAVDKRGNPLLLSLLFNDIGADDNLRYLLANGADPNAQARFGEPVLHAVIRRKKFGLAELLLTKGADPNAAHRAGLYKSERFWDTPLLLALREGNRPALTPRAVYEIPKLVTFLLTHGADPAVGGYIGHGKPLGEGPARDGLNESLSQAVGFMQPELLSALVNAAVKPYEPLRPDSLSTLLARWNRLETLSAVDGNGSAWDGQRAAHRQMALQLVSLGVPLTWKDDDAARAQYSIAPLSLPWLPDDLYLSWLQQGADVSDRSFNIIRIDHVDQSDALPLTIMLQQGKTEKVRMLLEYDAGLYRTPERCGMAVADMLAWLLEQDGPVGPLGARALVQVLERAAVAPACDLEQWARMSPHRHSSAQALARQANVRLAPATAK
ncbi:ankyrin repeat domain-containing protein [Achromobacter seleniivolatilans]|uniref:Ankyrin repeat domain-containing protein n=1 Tax=Achromobacter seleniivolatilans TaxID=3047478 RepID=A0ABY9M1H0_9BURK|nr:ankyrin repeat domain-containing protein [Achromobacter sp. R39]WMD20419.1 ankyrin repeat domain-containing protein [Achromobacter sp. R39]